MKTNVIYNEDCIEGIKKLPDDSIDLIVTDPPYEMVNNSKAISSSKPLEVRQAKIKNELDELDIRFSYDIEKLSYEIKRVMKHINAYFFCSKNQIPDYFDVYVKKCGCSFYILEWHKTNPTPLFNMKYIPDTEFCLYFFERGHNLLNPKSYEDGLTYYISPANSSDKRIYEHPTCKPVEFLRRLIRNSSKAGDVILDPFMGSGSTAIACIQENREYVGFEISKKYFDISSKRCMDEMSGIDDGFFE